MLRALILVPVLASCGSRTGVDYHRVALPGFSVELPTYLQSDPSAAYREGQLQANFGVRVVLVSWQLGGIDGVDRMPATVKSIVDQFSTKRTIELDPARSVQIGGQLATRVDGRFADVSFSFADVTCGSRSVLLGLSGLRDFEQMRDRMYQTFACAPIPADEAELVAVAKATAGSVPIGIDDPATLSGWRRVDDDPVTLTITNNKVVAMFASMPTEQATDGKAIVPQLVAGGTFVQTGSTSLGNPTALLEIERGTIKSEGEVSHASVTRWTCDDRTVVGVVMTANVVDRDAATPWLAKLRCARPEDPPLPLVK
ncbi:MAG: hypothetical protein WKG01_14925 [Kofleriaceae bacterium]